MRALGAALVCLLVGACGSVPAASVAGTSPSAAASPASSKSCGSTASPARTFNPAPNPPTPSAGTAGSISGSVNFPSEFLAPQLVYAVNVRGIGFGGAAVETIRGQGSYVLKGLVPGDYHVFSVARGSEFGSPACADYGAIYSAAVACGLTVACTNHAPLVVTVRSSQTTTGISPLDWYETPGDGSFQPPPSSIVPAIAHQASNGSFATPQAAANDYAQGRAIALLVNDLKSCPVNRACVVVGTEVGGSGASYFLGSSGSNGVIARCGTYVYFAQGAWHALAWRCAAGHVFPAVGETGPVLLGMGASPTDCANIRATAGLTAKVVGCAHDGNLVSLDGGPTYAPGANIDGLWWHVAGQGWIADDFLSRER